MRPIEKSKLDNVIDELFKDKAISEELACNYLNLLHSNIMVTEKLISRNLISATITFLVFLGLDTGLISKITLSGAELERKGIVMIMFPFLIAFFCYRASTLITYVEELHSVIALIYLNIKDTFYKYCLDILTHYPSARNIESHQTNVGAEKREKITTKVNKLAARLVQLILAHGPHAILVYTYYRTWYYNDLSKIIWVIFVIISFILTIRSLFCAQISSDSYTRRPEYIQLLKGIM